MTPAIVPADTAWMLMSTALVLLEEVHRIRTGDRDEAAVTPAAV